MKNLSLLLMTILALVLVLILATSCMNPFWPDLNDNSVTAEKAELIDTAVNQ